MSSPAIASLLLNQVASYLAMPIFVVDAEGDMAYFNEPAEALLGVRYAETGAMAQHEWASVWRPTDADGNLLPPNQIPLAVTMRTRRPAQGTFWIRGLDGVSRCLVVTAVPLEDGDGAPLGAAAIFWEG